MYSKKQVLNPETPVFNIRKVNKKAVGLKNVGEGAYFSPEAEH